LFPQSDVPENWQQLWSAGATEAGLEEQE